MALLWLCRSSRKLLGSDDKTVFFPFSRLTFKVIGDGLPRVCWVRKIRFARATVPVNVCVPYGTLFLATQFFRFFVVKWPPFESGSLRPFRASRFWC